MLLKPPPVRLVGDLVLHLHCFTIAPVDVAFGCFGKKIEGCFHVVK